ncbi:hypothetical protein RQP53_20415 [Paucibacter sp. APW11]|uniref:SPOR domain-containing protein n=1 Tax=Roseateles aquae TaxID=3077235 RepID=A0ABU3PGA6_9BURK|nr:hypothetical protein [Paucibacter sp. APW11]MDT9001652.1 hypothetical protein [Paucibacter sp. APW11]
MTAEDKRRDEAELDRQDAEVRAFLGGLRGAERPSELRPEQAGAYDEGQRLHRAFGEMPADGLRPDWSDVRRRAGLAAVSPEPPARHGDAANGPFWRWLAAAAVVAGVGLVVWPQWGPLSSGEAEPGWRGGARGQAQWLAPNPDRDAAELEAQLRGWGAEVLVERSPEGWRLQLRCSGTCQRSQVDARLAELETALDGDGRLTLLLRQR